MSLPSQQKENRLLGWLRTRSRLLLLSGVISAVIYLLLLSSEEFRDYNRRELHELLVAVEIDPVASHQNGHWLAVPSEPLSRLVFEVDAPEATVSAAQERQPTFRLSDAQDEALRVWLASEPPPKSLGGEAEPDVYRMQLIESPKGPWSWLRLRPKRKALQIVSNQIESSDGVHELPDRIRLQTLRNPEDATVTFRRVRLAERDVPVDVRWSGEPTEGHEVLDATADPPTVSVWVREDRLTTDTPLTLTTEQVRVPADCRDLCTHLGTVSLPPPPPDSPIVAPVDRTWPRVAVNFRTREQRKTSLVQVPVRMIGAAAGYEIVPETLTFRLRHPQTISTEELRAANLFITVNVDEVRFEANQTGLPIPLTNELVQNLGPLIEQGVDVDGNQAPNIVLIRSLPVSPMGDQDAEAPQ